jgi:hypothetical protein
MKGRGLVLAEYKVERTGRGGGDRIIKSGNFSVMQVLKGTLGIGVPSDEKVVKRAKDKKDMR